MALWICRPRTLAIVGNGFDLAHGYRTDYASFVRQTSSPYLERFRAWCDREDIPTWYQFEENIALITGRQFLRSMEEGCDFQANRQEVEELARVFRQIQTLLLDYLFGETARPPVPLPSVAQVLKGAAVLNFNYTHTAHAYTGRVFHVHGSLAEGDILLGYDAREEPCLAQWADVQWSKNICREQLAFRRHYLGRRHLSPQGRKYQQLQEGLLAVEHWENSGRGLDDEVCASIPRYRTLRRFLDRVRANPLPGLNLSAMRTVAVLGHGIEADRAYLTHILGRCRGLRRVVLFRYRGESEESFQSKRAFFLPHCGLVEQAYY